MMSSTVAAEPIKTTSKRRSTNFIQNAQKKFVKGGRKRSKSFSGCGLGKIKNCKPVLPTKFLLGGNINDPLNLNSLQDEEINRAMNAVTPKSSPIPTPPRRRGQIEVIIPPNINDPLNLIDCADDAEYEQQLCSPVKKGRKKKGRKRRTTSGTLYSDAEMAEAKTPEANKDSAKIPEGTETQGSSKPKELVLELSPKKDKNKRKSEEHKDNVKKLKYLMDKIVSPVIPQPGAWLKRTNNRNTWQNRPQRNQNKDANLVMPQFKDKNRNYQYGNYNRYYGYRNPQQEIDPRLKCFSHNRELFEGKDILDIGCNIGHITLSVARDFGAHSIVGIDIDKNLISIARKNIKHYVSSSTSPNGEGVDEMKPTKSSEFYPISMPILYGPIDIPGFGDKRKGQRFPHNVTFIQGNYVLDDDSLINTEQPQFDVILCLSITKWIHLNWGDEGIQQAFRRMYAQLRPGGKLILEPQNWASYKSKKSLTETIYKNYNSIEFFPDNFTQYLLSPEVGFAKSEILGFPQHHSKGFQRPIQVYTKSTMFPSERVECTSNCNENSSRVYVPLPTPETISSYPSPIHEANDKTCGHKMDEEKKTAETKKENECTKLNDAKKKSKENEVCSVQEKCSGRENNIIEKCNDNKVSNSEHKKDKDSIKKAVIVKDSAENCDVKLNSTLGMNGDCLTNGDTERENCNGDVPKSKDCEDVTKDSDDKVKEVAEESAKLEIVTLKDGKEECSEKT